MGGFEGPAHKFGDKEAQRVVAAVDVGRIGDELVPEVAVGKGGAEVVEGQGIERAQRGGDDVEQGAAGAQVADKERAGEDGGLFVAAGVHRVALARILDQKGIHLEVGHAGADGFGHDHAAVAEGLVEGRKVSGRSARPGAQSSEGTGWSDSL